MQVTRNYLMYDAKKDVKIFALIGDLYEMNVSKNDRIILHCAEGSYYEINRLFLIPQN